MILKSFLRIISNKTDQKDSSKNSNIENNSRNISIMYNYSIPTIFSSLFPF